MIQTNCKKCGAELFLREGYCVCNNCGEIYALPKEEEIEEILPEEENIIEEPVASEVEEAVKSETDEIEEVEETEEEAKEVEEEIKELTEEEKVSSPVVETVEKKKSKASAVIWVIVAIIGVAFACYFAASHLVIDTTNKDAEVFEKDEYAIEETLPEEEPEEIKEEVVSEEEEEPKEEIKEEIKGEKDVPAKKPVQNKKPVAKQPPVVKETPAIAYRIRKSADDSDTQIGAFSDIERAKSFASAHAADGYKVFDMSGNLVYQP